MQHKQHKTDILILSALEEEIRAIRAFLTRLQLINSTNKNKTPSFLNDSGSMDTANQIYAQRGECTITKGCWKGINIAAGATGPGKVLAAIHTQWALQLLKPEHIIYIGIAGALNPELNIYDVVIAVDSLQYDLSAAELGSPVGTLPKLKYGAVPCGHERFTPEIMQKITALQKEYFQGELMQPPEPKTVKGRILTGDSFLGRKAAKIKEQLCIDLQGEAVDMEGAAAALTAHIGKVPFTLIRLVSDTAIGLRPPKFKQFMTKSADFFLKLIQETVKELL